MIFSFFFTKNRSKPVIFGGASRPFHFLQPSPLENIHFHFYWIIIMRVGWFQIFVRWFLILVVRFQIQVDGFSFLGWMVSTSVRWFQFLVGWFQIQLDGFSFWGWFQILVRCFLILVGRFQIQLDDFSFWVGWFQILVGWFQIQLDGFSFWLDDFKFSQMVSVFGWMVQIQLGDSVDPFELWSFQP